MVQDAAEGPGHNIGVPTHDYDSFYDLLLKWPHLLLFFTWQVLYLSAEVKYVCIKYYLWDPGQTVLVILLKLFNLQEQNIRWESDSLTDFHNPINASLVVIAHHSSYGIVQHQSSSDI